MTINSLTTLILSAFVFIFFSSKAKQNNFNQLQKIKKIKNFQNTENDIIRISYNQKINEYEVNVIWKPNFN
jgi:recombinational DNA repair protein (RecF pathway)